MPLPKNIVVIGRRWFDKTYGNTYFSAEIIVDGERVEGINYEYGYGDHYLYRAFEKLEQLGLIPMRERHSNGSCTGPTFWARDNDVKLVYSVSDVKRKKDL